METRGPQQEQQDACAAAHLCGVFRTATTSESKSGPASLRRGGRGPTGTQSVQESFGASTDMLVLPHSPTPPPLGNGRISRQEWAESSTIGVSGLAGCSCACRGQDHAEEHGACRWLEARASLDVGRPAHPPCARLRPGLSVLQVGLVSFPFRASDMTREDAERH